MKTLDRVLAAVLLVTMALVLCTVVFPRFAHATTLVTSKLPHTAQVVAVVKDCRRGPPILYKDNKGRTHVVQKMTYNTGTRAIRLWTPKVSDPRHIYCNGYES